MSVFRPYRSVVAAVLLVMYAFIAAPVQWWHHHEVTTVSAAEHDQVDAATDASAELSCPVCSHKYSAYCTFDIISFETITLVKAPRYSDYTPQLVTASLFGCSNKGPPTC